MNNLTGRPTWLGPAFSSNCPSDKMPQPANVTDTQTVGQGKTEEKSSKIQIKIQKC